jgi:peroxiredoxin
MRSWNDSDLLCRRRRQAGSIERKVIFAAEVSVTLQKPIKENTMESFGKTLRSSVLLRCASAWFIALVISNAATAQEWEWAPKLQTGDQLPPIQAQDQNGEMRQLQDLTGDKGLILVLSRSFDWCPFCITQLNKLVEAAPQFQQLGIGIATMTYDSLETLKAAELDYDTTFPLLREADTKYFTALDVLNKDYAPGSRAYGIPEPGIFLVDTSGVIRFKFSEQDYRVRPDFAEVLAAAAAL